MYYVYIYIYREREKGRFSYLGPQTFRSRVWTNLKRVITSVPPTESQNEYGRSLLLRAPGHFDRASGLILIESVVPGGLRYDFELFVPEIETLKSYVRTSQTRAWPWERTFGIGAECKAAVPQHRCSSRDVQPGCSLAPAVQSGSCQTDWGRDKQL